MHLKCICQVIFCFIKHIYAHNFVLEIFLDFGVLLGIIIIIAFAYIIIKSFINVRKDKMCLKLFFSIIVIFAIKHMVSASFITSLDFWFYFGLAFHFASDKKDNINNYLEVEK